MRCLDRAKMSASQVRERYAITRPMVPSVVVDLLLQGGSETVARNNTLLFPFVCWLQRCREVNKGVLCVLINSCSLSDGGAILGGKYGASKLGDGYDPARLSASFLGNFDAADQPWHDVRRNAWYFRAFGGTYCTKRRLFWLAWPGVRYQICSCPFLLL